MDIQALSSFIKNLPLQAELNLGEKHYLFAHAMASPPSKERPDEYYLQGDWKNIGSFVKSGIPGYVTCCGHRSTSYFKDYAGQYLDESPSIWRNQAGNVYMMDCGCGFVSGKLACMCIETGERFYA